MKGLIAANIAIRHAHLSHGRLSQLPYGLHKRHSVATPHQGEQRTIATIKELSDQGLSLRAIAAVLNQMKVPTKNRGQRWLPETVRRILPHD